MNSAPADIFRNAGGPVSTRNQQTAPPTRKEPAQMKHLFRNSQHDFEHCQACREYDEGNKIIEIHDAYGKKMYINAAHAERKDRYIPLFKADGKPLTRKVRKPHSREYYEEREMLHPANICRHPITTFTTYHDPIDNQYVDFCHACMPWIDTTPAQLTLF